MCFFWENRGKHGLCWQREQRPGSGSGLWRSSKVPWSIFVAACTSCWTRKRKISSTVTENERWFHCTKWSFNGQEEHRLQLKARKLLCCGDPHSDNHGADGSTPVPGELRTGRRAWLSLRLCSHLWLFIFVLILGFVEHPVCTCPALCAWTPPAPLTWSLHLTTVNADINDSMPGVPERTRRTWLRPVTMCLVTKIRGISREWH